MRFSHRLPLLLLSVLGCGLLLAGSLLWPVPDAIRPERHVVSLRVTDRSGHLLREFRPDGRGTPISLDAVPDAAVRALIATEDARFFEHVGIDVVAIGRALRDNVRAGHIVSGASTLTMQAARSLRGPSARSLPAKLAEAHLALRLELQLSKPEILELWLNRVSFGNRAHGIEAAARLYFGKPARDLTLAEASYLIGLPQSPSRLDPFRHPDAARRRHRRVLAALAEAGHVSRDEATRLHALPLAIRSPSAAFSAPHFTQWVAALVPDRATELRTSLDGALQAVVEAELRAHLARLDASVTNAAALVLDNATGEVLAYAGSADFWDARAGGQNDGVQMLRQPGSTLKPFTYALALESRRYTAASILPDVELNVSEAGGAFSPANYDERFHGPVSLRQALACSYNIPAVRLAQAFGPERLLEQLHRAGFASLTRSPAHYGVGLTLGNGEVRLLELARAYAGLARGGSLPTVRPVRWYRTASRDTSFAAAPAARPMSVSPEVAYLLADILSDPIAREPAFGRGGPLELPFPVAVKTGTSKDYRDNWAVGFSPRHTVAVWVGNFDGAAMRWVSGVSGAGPILHAIFRALGPGGHFPLPTGLVHATISPASGRLPGPHTPNRRAELFLSGTVPTDTCRVHQPIRIDIRTGARATPETPAAFARTEVFLDFPPEYHAWMRDEGLPSPPPDRRAGTAAAGTTLRFSKALRVDFPQTGSAFQLDPVLKRDYQQLHLRGTSAPDVSGVGWWVDEQPLEDDRWRLIPGKHKIELRGTGADGEPLRSPPAVITVYEAAPAARQP